MPRNLNLPAAVRWIHSAPPTDLDGVYQAAKAKVEALGLRVGRTRGLGVEDLTGDPGVNVRGIVQFIEGCENVDEGDEPGLKKSKEEANGKLLQLFATLAARCNAAGYKPPEAEKPTEPAPLPAPTPDPKPLA